MWREIERKGEGETERSAPKDREKITKTTE